MIEPLNKKYVKMVAKIVYEGLSMRNLTDHALQYKSRYHGHEGFKFRNDHNLANDIVKSVLKNPQSSKIAVAGYEMKADGRVRYVAYAYSPAMSDAGVAKIITADTQYPPTKFLQPQILTTYRERLTSDIKQMLNEVMPIYYIMEGKTDDEYRAEQEMLQDIQVDVPNMEKLHGKYFEFRSKRNKIDKSIARLFDEAEGNYLDVPYESMKDLVLSRSKMNKTLDKIHQMIRRIKPNFKEPEVVVNTIPSDEYESLVKEYIEVGAKQYDKLFAEYMTPEDVEEVNATFKSLDEKLATSVPAQTEGVARMESMEAQYKAFIESVCAEFDCKEAISPLQEGFVALMESATPILFHFLSPEHFEDIALYNKFTPSTAEENHNGKGNRYMSFSRTGSFREGYPVLLQSDCGYGSDWGVVRLTLDGDLMNRYSTFKVGNGRGKPKTRHSMKFQPFDWANHDYGPDFGDEYDIEDRVDNGKEWMMKSEGSFDVTLPYDYPDETMRTVFDNEGHPYSQAEDRMVTTAPSIPNVSRFIKRVDIVLVLGNFREDNEDDRLHFLDCLLDSKMKRKIHIYTSVKDCEHGRNEKPWNILAE